MLRRLRTLSALMLGLMLVMVVVQQAPAWTPWGPTETWQTAALAYGTRYFYSPVVSPYNQPPFTPGNVPYTELGGPKYITQASRLNVAVITYGCDASFLSYYGVEGAKAVDAAFAILNNLPKASDASANLTEFITDGNQQINYTARALSMLDLKSVVLQIMIEHMGLLGETHVWDLLGDGGTCGAMYYQVGLRNFDPITWNPTTYVNGTDYTWSIADNCGTGTAIADAMEEVVGVGPGLSMTTSAVATQEALQLGGYYLGITRDDFGGLRYLYSKNNYTIESLPTDCMVGTPSRGSAWAPVTTNSSAATGNSGSPWSPVSTNSNTFTNTFGGGVLGGVEKILFVKVQADSLIGYTWPTNTMTFSIPLLSNYTVMQLPVMRSNVGPDILITASNLLNTPGAGQDQPYTRTASFLAPPAGSPTINQVKLPTNSVVFNNIGPIYINENTSFTQGSAFFLYPYFQFGSFDGSTNPPITYPSRTSLAALLKLETTAPSGQNTTSPFNPLIMPTNTTATGTGAGTAGGGGGGGAGGGGN